MFGSRFTRFSVLTLALLCVAAICAFGLRQARLIQRVNVSKLTYGPCKLGNAAASNDSQGKVSGSITLTCANAPTSPASVTQFDLSPDGSAWIAFGSRKTATGGPADTISIEGTYDADAATERLVNPRIVGMKLNGNAVVPASN